MESDDGSDVTKQNGQSGLFLKRKKTEKPRQSEINFNTITDLNKFKVYTSTVLRSVLVNFRPPGMADPRNGGPQSCQRHLDSFTSDIFINCE